MMGADSEHRPWGKHLGAALIMAVGVTVVFAALIGMNAGEPPQRKVSASRSVAFRAAPRRRRPPARRVQRSKPRTRRQSPPRAPLPDLALNVSGIDFGIPAFGADGLDEASNTLLGQSQALGDMLMTDGAVDVPPQPTVRPRPSYPARARAKGITGYVTLEFVIDQQGQVREPEVTEAAPNGVFEHAALEAVRQWRFTPAQYRGKATRVKRRLTLRFELA